MDLAFWGFALLAVAIAVFFSSLELVDRYEARKLREIFVSRYYVAFAFLNALLCFLVYWALPYVGEAMVPDTGLSTALDWPLGRALVAGLGYLLIVRTSIADFTFRGETVGTGLDFAYKVMSDYLLRHHRQELRRKLREDFGKAYQGGGEDPVIFLGAAEFLMTQVPQAERADVDSKVGVALRGNPPRDVLCLTLYQIIRDLTEDAEDAQTEIERKRGEIQKNPQSAEKWRQDLSWLYE